MPPKRTRKAAEADTSKGSMEDAAVALAGVEGALKPTTTATATGKRKASGAATSKRLPKKAAAKRERSNSLEQLTEVAASLLTNPTDEDLSVPNPMATAAAAAAAAPAPMPSLPPAKNGGEQPTGFRKKAAARPKAAAKKETKGDGNSEEGKKTQIQYNPDVPMSKEQLTAWRREMRRVRNRESAAASRRKVRDRIQELEQEVKGWKDRYEEVMARLAQAEGKKEEEANV
mmetsp:Transcript_24246/g.34695  ORF Transcript_24246/g.34695 Transcript_24246/m.34695 type:complete len:230 (-) Transcript_24246:55-744(-)